MRTAFYDCPECPHYKGDGLCPCVRPEDMGIPWWRVWWLWKLCARLAKKPVGRCGSERSSRVATPISVTTEGAQ